MSCHSVNVPSDACVHYSPSNGPQRTVPRAAILQRSYVLLMLIASSRCSPDLGIGPNVPGQCRKNIDKLVHQAQDDGMDHCADNVCGPLPFSSATPVFQERLSDSCAAVMAAYRAFGAPPTGFRTPSGVHPAAPHRCGASPEGVAPTNPVVIHRAGSSPFIMCTVPKAACSNLRKLLFVLLNFFPELPDSTPGNTIPVDPDNVHRNLYPTIWHYREPRPHADLTGLLPSFIVARNPYVRLVSGFLDKMVVKGPNHDLWNLQVCCLLLTVKTDAILLRCALWKSQLSFLWGDLRSNGLIARALGSKCLQDMNTALGRELDKPFRATAGSFAHFVRLLARHGVMEGTNDHFRLASRACDPGTFRYEYYLRLEDMAQWLPCVSEVRFANTFRTTLTVVHHYLSCCALEIVLTNECLLRGTFEMCNHGAPGAP